jgi:hypothetical protein
MLHRSHLPKFQQYWNTLVRMCTNTATPQSRRVRLRLRFQSQSLPISFNPPSSLSTIWQPQLIITSPSLPTSPTTPTLANMALPNRWPRHKFEVRYPSAGKINSQKWAMLPKHLNVLVEEKASDILSMIADATAFRHILEHGVVFHNDPGDYYHSVAFKLRKVLLHPCWYSSFEGPGQYQKDFLWHYDWLRKREEELCKSIWDLLEVRLHYQGT